MSKAIRSEEGKKRHAAKVKARHRQQRLDPAYRAKEAEAARLRYEKNKDKYRDIALKSISKRRSEINAKRREKRKLDSANVKLDDKKHRGRNLKSYIAKLKRGEIGLDEFSRRVGKHLAWYDERIRREGRKQCNDSLRGGKADNAVRKIKA